MRQSGVPTRLMELTRGLLPESARDKLFVDMAGNVLVGTTKIGVQEKGRFLIDNFSLFSGISFPPAMRTMAQAKKMVVFIEVTETEASICAGSVLGQKILHSRLG